MPITIERTSRPFVVDVDARRADSSPPGRRAYFSLPTAVASRARLGLRSRPRARFDHPRPFADCPLSPSPPGVPTRLRDAADDLARA